MDKNFSGETNVNGGSGTAETERDKTLQPLEEEKTENQQEIENIVQDVDNSDKEVGFVVEDESTKKIAGDDMHDFENDSHNTKSLGEKLKELPDEDRERVKRYILCGNKTLNTIIDANNDNSSCAQTALDLKTQFGLNWSQDRQRDKDMDRTSIDPEEVRENPAEKQIERDSDRFEKINTNPLQVLDNSTLFAFSHAGIQEKFGINDKDFQMFLDDEIGRRKSEGRFDVNEDNFDREWPSDFNKHFSVKQKEPDFWRKPNGERVEVLDEKTVKKNEEYGIETGAYVYKNTNGKYVVVDSDGTQRAIDERNIIEFHHRDDGKVFLRDANTKKRTNVDLETAYEESVEEQIEADLDNAEQIVENAKLDEDRKKSLLTFVYDRRFSVCREQIEADLDNAEEIIENAKLDEERKRRLLNIVYNERYGGYKEKVKADLDNAEEIIENAKLDEERKRWLLYFVYNERYGGYEEKVKADLDNAEEIIENAKLDEWRKNRLYYDLSRIRSSKIDDLIDNLEKNSDNFEELVQGAGFNVDKISKECFLHRLCEKNGPESRGVERIAETILGRNPREFVEWLAEERGKQDRAGKARFTRFYNSSPTFLQCREIVDEENRQMREETEALNKIRNADKKMIWEATSLDDVKKIIKEMGSLDNARKQIAQEYDENGAIEVSSMEPGKWRLDVESHSSEKKKETPVTFGIRKVEAVTNLAKLVSEINPDTNVQLIKGTFPREDKEAGSSSGRYDNAYMRAAGTYLGFMFEYNGQKCVMAESFGDDAATYLYRCPKDKNPLDYFARTKQSNYQDNPNCAVVDHLSKENIGVSIAEVQQKALRFFTENLVDENGRTVVDENGNPLPDKNIVFYKSEGGREKWERNFGSKYNYTLPELKDEYSEGEKESIRQIIETSKAQLSAYEKWLEEHDVFNAK